MFNILLPPLIAFVLTLAGLFAALKFFPRLGLMDRPKEYGLTRKPIPYSAGMVIYVVFVLCTVVFVPLTATIIATICAATLIVVVSFLDDRYRLNPILRLSVQVIAALILVFGGLQIQQISNPLGAPFLLDAHPLNIFGHIIWPLSAALVVIWIVLMMNVTNWLDGIPGLTSGISAIAQITVFILSLKQFHVVDQSAVIVISSVLAASCLAFLLFDFSPPKLLLGDTGSMFLGFMLGALSILAGGKLATALLIMGLPVLDAVFVTVRRVLRGSSPLKGDYTHLHHTLLRVGLSERAALLFHYLVCSAFAAVALLVPSTYDKFLAFIVIFVISTLLSWILSRKSNHA